MEQSANHKIVLLGNGDVALFRKLIELFDTVFETERPAEVSDGYLSALLGNPFLVVYAAVTDSNVIGGVTAHVLPICTAERAELFIYDIAVKHEFQRTGIGQGLLSAIRGYCSENGFGLFFVEANEEDQHAVDFYHRAGGNAESVVHFNFEVEGLPAK